jgi:putative tryptophan/tyrosine transport system substrate-binding protein
MTGHIGRREFISLLGGAVVAWPLAARAQQPAMPVVGFLNSQSPGVYAPMAAAFHQGLSEIGFVEGQNVAIEYRWAQGRSDRLRALAAELVRRHVALIVAAGSSSALAAKAETTTLPIVFSAAVDPVALGLVASLDRPGGNVTGVTNLSVELVQKQVEMLHELVPTATVTAALLNPTFPGSESQSRDLQAPARKLGLELHVLHASTERDFEPIFAAMVQLRAGMLVIGADPFFFGHRDQIAALAIRHRMPAIFFLREFATVGGLMSYGPIVTESYRQVGIYAGRTLKGEKSADLPVMQSTKFQLVINLNTAKALGLEIPPTLLARADEVIQ